MEIFIDSADITEIRRAYFYGVLDGVTTNPSLIKKAAQKHHIKDMDVYIGKLLLEAKGTPVSLEVIGNTYEHMIEQGEILHRKFNRIAKNVVIKIPINPSIEQKHSNHADGLRAIKHLTNKGIPTNATLIFTPEQALLAAKAGATYASPFAGRIDDYIRTKTKTTYEKTDYYPAQGKTVKNKLLEDNGIVSGVDLVSQCVQILQHYNLQTKILAASLRNTRQIRECALVGADVATMPLNVIEQLLQHKKTMEGMKGFNKDIVPEYKEVFTKK